jgi:hypothetical protein
MLVASAAAESDCRIESVRRTRRRRCRKRTESFVEQRLAHTANCVRLCCNAYVDLPFQKHVESFCKAVTSAAYRFCKYSSRYPSDSTSSSRRQYTSTTVVLVRNTIVSAYSSDGVLNARPGKSRTGPVGRKEKLLIICPTQGYTCENKKEEHFVQTILPEVHR